MAKGVQVCYQKGAPVSSVLNGDKEQRRKEAQGMGGAVSGKLEGAKEGPDLLPKRGAGVLHSDRADQTKSTTRQKHRGQKGLFSEKGKLAVLGSLTMLCWETLNPKPRTPLTPGVSHASTQGLLGRYRDSKAPVTQRTLSMGRVKLTSPWAQRGMVLGVRICPVYSVRHWMAT